MSKSESIPKMWETVKDLKPESIKTLKTSLKHMLELFQDTSNDNIEGTGFKRHKEEGDIIEIGSPATKAQKSDPSIENITCRQAFDEEGL